MKNVFLALALTTTLFAAPSPKVFVERSYSPCDVYLSSPCYTIEGEFRALVLKPSSNHLHYAAEAVPLPLPSPHWIIFDIHPDYHFAFELGLNGILHGTNTNIQAKWEHYESSDSSSKLVGTNNMIGPFFEIGPDASAYVSAKGKAKFHLEAADLDYGILINFGNRLQMNWKAGVGFAWIKQTIDSRFSNPGGTIVRSIHTPSSFTGAGPEFGADFQYRIVKGFHFVGSGLAAILVGASRNHTTYKALSPALAGLGTSIPNKQTTAVKKGLQTIPELRGLLGLSYSCWLNCSFWLKVEAGYETRLFVNALQSVNMGSEVITPPVIPDTVGVFARTFEKSLSDFALAGPYVTLDLAY